MGSKNCDCILTDTALSSERLDTLLHILSDRYRRQLLYYAVEEEQDVLQHSEVVDHLIRWNSDLGAADRDPLQARLHHVVLPKLADAGLLDYDTRSKTIRYRGDSCLDEYIPLLSAVEFG